MDEEMAQKSDIFSDECLHLHVLTFWTPSCRGSYLKILIGTSQSNFIFERLLLQQIRKTQYIIIHIIAHLLQSRENTFYQPSTMAFCRMNVQTWCFWASVKLSGDRICIIKRSALVSEMKALLVICFINISADFIC